MAQFEFDFSQSESSTIDVDGFTLTARIVRDDDGGAPWDNSDGHGPVSDWQRRGKAPHELIIAREETWRGDTGTYRFYDMREAQRIALRDAWGVDGGESLTPRQRAYKAARADYEYLKAWCNDEWHYVGVVLSVARNGVTLDSHAAALWGIESNSGDYLGEVASDLALEALDIGKAAIASLCDCDGGAGQ